MRMMTAILSILAALALTTQANAYPGQYGPEATPDWQATPYSRVNPWNRDFPRHYAKAHHGRAHARHEPGYRQHAKALHAPRPLDIRSPAQVAGLPGPCYLARRQGGSCGCVAMGHIFGRYDHVLNGMNLWLARTWLGFPRSSPKPGTAAVWGTHHVEAVVADNGDGTITTSGPYGNRRVKIASVAIVDPRGGYVGHREGHSRYAYRHWQHRRYARAW